MFTLSIIGQKGGSGKTTVALGLAVTAARVGETVVVIDTDPQTNAMNWKDRRGDENPMVISVQASRIRHTLDAARANHVDLVIIDTAGKNETASIEAARLSDLVLVPSRPQIFDMETLPTVRTMLRAANDPAAFILYNFIPPQGVQLVEKLKALTETHCGLPAAPVHLTQRAVYAEAQAQGKGPQEIDPDNRAVAELEGLYLFIKSHVNMSKGEHHGKEPRVV
jgi:chromosome partitioning protein